MVFRTALLTSVLLSTALTAPAAGNAVRDVMIVERDGAHVWIALDAMPAALAAQSDPGRLTLQLDGFASREPRRIVPVDGAPLTLVRVAPRGEATLITVEGAFAMAEASLRQGGIWIALDGSLSGAASSGVLIANAAVSDASQGAGRANADEDTPRQDQTGSSALGDAAERAQARAPSGSDRAAQSGARASRAATDVSADAQTAPPPQGSEMSRPAQTGRDDTAPEAAIGANPDAPGPCDATAAAVQNSPWDLDALTRHADCLVGMDERANAAGLYERVLAFDPTHFRAAIGLARIREAQGRGEEAARLYERAASAALTDGEALAARAAAERNRDDEE